MRNLAVGLTLATLLLPLAARGQSTAEQSKDRPEPEQIADPHHQLIAAAEQDLSVATANRDKKAAEVAALQKQIGDKTWPDVTTINRAIERLQEQQEQLQLDEAGAQGRARGIDEAIKKYTDWARGRAASDPVVAEMEKVADVRKQQLQRFQELYKNGAIAMSEVSAAEAAVAESRAALATAKQHAAGGNSANDALDLWNRQAIELSIEAMERSARLQYISARLAQYRQLFAEEVQMDQLNVDLSNANGQVSRAKANLDKLKAQLPRE